MKESSVIIIGAGFAGLSAGIYAQMNGYRSEIYELHSLPGGLCTAWKRDGYTIDGCIHWLVGSSPESGIYRMWEEVGVVQNRKFIDMDEYLRYECKDGRTLVFYTDIDKLRQHLLEFSPDDKHVIEEFINGVKLCLPIDMPASSAPALVKLKKSWDLGVTFLFKWNKIKKWMKTTTDEFSNKFKDPALRNAFLDIWMPGFSMFFILATFAYLHRKNAGYPLGGSLPMSQAMADRYEQLGGKIRYNSPVRQILTEEGRATGIMLADGSVAHAGKIISAADGYATLYKMLEGKFGDESTFKPYNSWPVFPPLLYIGLGVSRSFQDEPRTISGIAIELDKPCLIGDREHSRINVHIYNQDPYLAPEGKTSVVIMMGSDYEYWKKLSNDKAIYRSHKEEVAARVIEILEKRFPGITQQIEMVDVATPLTFERYTGNWKGSFEGWLLTPENSNTVIKRMPQVIHGLKNFYMCGQWVEPGGGLPSGLMSARRLLKRMCREDGKRFVTKV